MRLMINAGSLALYSLATILATLGGALFLNLRRDWAKRNLWRFLAFGGGVLLGITFLHLLPEAWALDPRWAGGAVLVSFALFFAVEGFTVLHACSELMEDCHVHTLGHGAFAALFTHGLADGLAMAFAFMESASLGLVVSMAILFHKFSDGITLTSLFWSAGHSHGKTWALTSILALATPLGVVIGVSSAPLITDKVLATLLGLAAGGFLYISTADILPRIHRTRDRFCWLFLVAGVAASWAVSHFAGH